MRWQVAHGSRRLIVALVAPLSLVIAFSVPWRLNFLRDTLARHVEATTGRAFAIEGNLVWHWWSRRLVAERVRFANPAWAGRDTMFSAQRVDARLRLWPLLTRRTLDVPAVRVLKPDLWLETTADGRFNARLDRRQRRDDRGVTLGVVALDQGVLRWVQRDRETDVAVRLNTSDDDQRLHAQASGRWRGLDLQARGHGDAVLRLRDARRPFALDVQGRIGATRLHLAGTLTGVAQPTAADLRLVAEGDTLAQWYRIAGIGLPHTPPYTTRGRVRLADGVWHYDDFQSRVGRSDLGGNVRYERREPRPLIAGRLVSQRLDLHDFLPVIGKAPMPPGAKAVPGPRSRRGDRPRATRSPRAALLPQWTIDASKWDTFDADVQFDGRSLKNVGRWPLDALQMHVRLHDRRLVLEPLRIALGGGTLAGTFAIDAREDPMRARLVIDGRGVRLQALVAPMRNEQLALGTVNARLRLMGQGDSLGRMLATADGEAQVAMGRGRISNLLLEVAGLDGQETLGFLVRGDEAVTVRCALADVGFDDGVMTTREVVFDTNDTIVHAGGRVDFARERLDLRIRPVAKDTSLVSLRVPFRVTGSFRDPDLKPEAGKLALRAGGALLLGSVAPLAALLPLIETGPGENADCQSLVQRARSQGVPVTHRRGAAQPRSGPSR